MHQRVQAVARNHNLHYCHRRNLLHPDPDRGLGRDSWILDSHRAQNGVEILTKGTLSDADCRRIHRCMDGVGSFCPKSFYASLCS